MRRAVLQLVALGMLCAGSARAGQAFFDFNSDPATSGLLTNYGNAIWDSQDGAGYATNVNDGYLRITDAARGQGSQILFSDFDGGMVVKAFTFEADFRIGNGTQTPADGFSVNYARANDPTVVAAQGGGSPTGWATGPNCEANLPEEGTQTGIAIGFDAYNSGGSAPYCNGMGQTDPSYIGPDIIGISVRVDGILVRQVAMNTQNGTVTDPTSLQTGPYDGSFSTTPLGWAHLKVELDTNQTLTVTWKGTVILDKYQTTYLPSPGRLIFAGRTGDLYQHQDIDNISVTTIPAATALVGTASGFADGFAVTINDSGQSVIDTTKTPTAKLNGVSVTPLSLTKSGGTSTVTYHGFPVLLPVGSSNYVEISATDTNNNTITGARSFVVPAYSILPAGDAVAGVNTSLPGFKLLPWQSGEEPNRVYWMLEQLAGLHGANEADLSQATDNGYIDLGGRVINFNISPFSAGGGDAGNFQQPNYPETLFPGIPGANGTNGSTAVNIVCYLQFQNTGVYDMGVNSDDGFLVSEGKNPNDWFSLWLGSYNDGRGASDSIFTIVVTNAGFYPVRLAWENGYGELPNNGANLEWFTVKNGIKYLLNDANATNTSGVKAFYSGPALPAFVSALQPNPGQGGMLPFSVFVQLTDSGTTVSGTPKLYLNGALTSPTVTKAGKVTSVQLTLGVANAMPAGLNTAALVWSDSGGAANSNVWTFTVAPYATLPVDLATAVGSASNPGFRLRTFQTPNTNILNGWKNIIQMANQAMEGFEGLNVADTTTFTNNGYMWLAGTDAAINFSQNSSGVLTDNGNFRTPDHPDAVFPGLGTWTTGTTAMDNDAMEVLTYLEFANPGLYQMGVNSDDGFRVSCAEGQSRHSMLTVTAPAKVAGDLPAMMTQNGLQDSTFGGPLPSTPIVSQAVLANPLIGDTPLVNAAAVAGKICILQRGTVAFTQKCKAAQDAGAVAVIIVNNSANAGTLAGAMGGSDASITIPCLWVPYEFADVLLTNATADATSPLTLSVGDDSSVRCGEANYGKGSSDITFAIRVLQAGVYPFRLIWENAGGDANCEWFLQDLTTGTKTLVNDSTGPVKAFITRAGRPTLSIARAGAAVTITYTGVLQSSTTVNGTFTDVTGANSPYTVPSGGPTMLFYRSR